VPSLVIPSGVGKGPAVLHVTVMARNGGKKMFHAGLAILHA
jgi:hypothetical protein